MAAFQMSPAVTVNEFDLSAIIPQVASTEGGLAGVFRWGPVDERVLIDTEINLALRFGTPTNFNAETWFTAANFMGYGGPLYVVRTANCTSNTANAAHNAFAVAEGANAASINAASQVVKNNDDFLTKAGTFDANVLYIAKYPGVLGSSLRVSVCGTANQYSSTINLVPNTQVNSITSGVSMNLSSNTATISIYFNGTGDITSANLVAQGIKNSLVTGDLILVGNTDIGTQYLKVASVSAVTTIIANSVAVGQTLTISTTEPYRLRSAWTGTTLPRAWEFYGLADTAPTTSEYVASFGNTAATDELHLVVVDDFGQFTNVPGTVLETYKNLSRATDAMTKDGSTNYYKNVINQNSQYIWSINDRSGAASANAALVATSTATTPYNGSFVFGADGDSEVDVPLNIIARGFDLFASAEDVDISLIMQGKAKGGVNGEALGNYLIDNVAEARKDCVAFISPSKATVVSNKGNELHDLLLFRNGSNSLGGLRSTSYAFLDSGYKYQYDKYNDVYRWIPLNGDMAGLCVRTDQTNDAWWSPAGYNRGQIKNVVKLAFNPRKADRDELYKAGINSVVSFPGQGTVLFGDKTLLARQSAFNRINVRRLFIIIEKAIATAAKGVLFEFNDSFTRSSFKNMVIPYLRDIKGRRGITDFLVVCDGTNNTPQVIDSNEFRGDMYIKANRSINYVTLNFIATTSGSTFVEDIGRIG